jgi:hypothetical protein
VEFIELRKPARIALRRLHQKPLVRLLSESLQPLLRGIPPSVRITVQKKKSYSGKTAS